MNEKYNNINYLRQLSVPELRFLQILISDDSLVKEVLCMIEKQLQDKLWHIIGIKDPQKRREITKAFFWELMDLKEIKAFYKLKILVYKSTWNKDPSEEVFYIHAFYYTGKYFQWKNCQNQVKNSLVHKFDLNTFERIKEEPQEEQTILENFFPKKNIRLQINLSHRAVSSRLATILTKS